MQKHYSFFIFTALLVLFFTACNQTKTNETEGAASENTTATDAPQVLVSDGDTSFVVTPTEAAPSLSGDQSAASGPLNPEHGKPGHRCDIAVGAPLNSPASAPQLPSTPPAPTAAAPAVAPATGSVAEGTNPPHGEPGHDCAIPVGAPLNKK